MLGRNIFCALTRNSWETSVKDSGATVLYCEMIGPLQALAQVFDRRSANMSLPIANFS
jgi:hypothetical protein